MVCCWASTAKQPRYGNWAVHISQGGMPTDLMPMYFTHPNVVSVTSGDLLAQFEDDSSVMMSPGMEVSCLNSERLLLIACSTSKMSAAHSGALCRAGCSCRGLCRPQSVEMYHIYIGASVGATGLQQPLLFL